MTSSNNFPLDIIQKIQIASLAVGSILGSYCLASSSVRVQRVHRFPVKSAVGRTLAPAICHWWAPGREKHQTQYIPIQMDWCEKGRTNIFWDAKTVVQLDHTQEAFCPFLDGLKLAEAPACWTWWAKPMNDTETDKLLSCKVSYQTR